MTDKEQKELRAYCAFLLKEFGFQLSPSDPVIPALYTIHKEMELCLKANTAIATRIEEASEKVQPKIFQFNREGEAWEFQRGITIRWVLVGLMILLFSGIAFWYWSSNEELSKAKSIINTANHLTELLQRTQVSQEGYYFIDFTASKDDSIHFFSQYYRLNPKTIRVYLGK